MYVIYRRLFFSHGARHEAVLGKWQLKVSCVSFFRSPGFDKAERM